MTAEEPALSIREVSKRYGSEENLIEALQSVSVGVAAGEIVALLGNNGAGKSTLMSICAGLLTCDSGTVSVEGEVVTGGRGPSRRLGLAPQEEAIYPTLTVRKNLHYFGRLAGLAGAELERRITEVSTHLLIGELLERRASELSGGQRRRLHTGLALMHRPSVILLDEPTVGVDIDARADILDFVRSTAASGAAVLYSTHQLHEVETLGARVVIIHHGRVLAAGSAEELVAAHAPPTAELLFDRSDIELPPQLRAAIDSASSTPVGEHRIVVRVADASTHLPDLIQELDAQARASLRGAVVLAPSLEQAYLRLTRGLPSVEEADMSHLASGDRLP